MSLGPVPMFPPVPGAFGAETSPFSSVIATTGGASTKTVLPVGWVQGILVSFKVFPIYFLNIIAPKNTSPS